MSAAAGPRWLDALARRAAHGQVATTAAVAPVAAAGGGGLSRRSLLWTAGVAVILGGPLRFALPSPARADAVSDCVAATKQLAFQIFQDCVKKPLEDFSKYQKAIDLTTAALKTETNPAKRRRLLSILDRATAGQGRVARQIEQCNFTFIDLRVDAERACFVKHNPPPAGGGVGGTGGGATPCPSGTSPCADGLCCFGSDVCCSCRGVAQCCVAVVGCACCG